MAIFSNPCLSAVFDFFRTSDERFWLSLFSVSPPSAQSAANGLEVFNLGDFGNLGSSGNLLPLAVPPPAFPRSADSFGCLAFQLLKLQAPTKNKLKV